MSVLRSTVAVAALLSFAPALAAGNAADGLQAMKELNVIVFGDMSSGHDVEGKTFVGGKLTGNGIFGIGNGSQGSFASDRPTLTVLGSASGGKIHNGSNGGSGKLAATPGLVVGGSASNFNFNTSNVSVKVGGALSNTNGSSGSSIEVGGAVSNVNGNGATIQSNLGAPFSTALVSGLSAEKTRLYENLTALSAVLGGMETTLGSGINYSDWNNVKLTAVSGDNGFAVVNVDAAQFFGTTRGLSYNFAPGVTTVVNVQGTGSYTWNFNTLSGAAYNPYVIYNFVDATSLTTNTMVRGSILAPNASVSNRTPIEGTLVAGSFKQGGEVHLGTFAGNIGFDTPAVPEPATWAMLIAGFGLVGMSLRRRRALGQVAA